MALGANHLVNSAASVQEFIPELWSDDILAAYKSNLVAANLVSKINHVGKKGDAIHIPVPTRGSANVKATSTQVTLNQNNSSEVQVYLGAHYEYSVIMEDILEVQALPSLRRFHTDDAGYALASRIDSDILDAFYAKEGQMSVSAGAMAGGGITDATWDTTDASYQAAVLASDGSTAFTDGSGDAITDAGIRKMIQTLDDNNVPGSNRFIIIPPVAKNTLLGLARFTEQAFTGEMGSANSIRNGRIGDIYGISVYVSSNCPTTTAGNRIGIIAHKDAVVFAEQKNMRSQAQYKQEYLGTLMTSDCIYGVQKLRDEAAVAFGLSA